VAVSVPSEIGELLARWRVDVAARSGAEVAVALGVARSTISNWESAQRSPSATTLADLDRSLAAGGGTCRSGNGASQPSRTSPENDVVA
jgi:transcriptional regulator with XRE-family HTH domain